MRRRLETLILLIVATIVGVAIVYLEILPPFVPPLLLGLGISFSNDTYMKYRLSQMIIPFAFVIIFLWGTIPFFLIGDLLGLDKFGATVIGCAGCFLLVCVTLKLNILDLYLQPVHWLILCVMALITVYLHAIITGQTVENYHWNLRDQFPLMQLLYQLSMIVLFLAMMTPLSFRTGGPKAP